jgi:hypothetical protein
MKAAFISRGYLVLVLVLLLVLLLPLLPLGA